MSNTINILKGFCLTWLSYVGVQVIKQEHYLFIKVSEGSAGWYIIHILPMLLLIWGLASIRKVVIRHWRCFQVKYFRNIKKHIDNGSC